MSTLNFHYSPKDLRNDISLKRASGIGVEELNVFLNSIIEQIIDTSSDKAGMRVYNSAKNSFLHTLVNANVSSEVLKFAISKASNVDVRSMDNGSTPLMEAIANGKINIATVLLESGANIKLKDRDGLGLLHHSAFSGDLEVFKFALQINPEQLNEFSRGSYDVLLSIGQVPVVEDESPVIGRHYDDDYDDVYLNYCKEDELVERSDFFENEGISPLFIAIECSNAQLVEELLCAGADPNLCSPSIGCNALTFNATCVHSRAQDLEEIQELLIKFGAHIKNKDLRGYDTFAGAAVAGNSKLLIHILNKYEIDLSAQYSVLNDFEKYSALLFGNTKTQFNKSKLASNKKIGKIKDFIESNMKKTSSSMQRQRFEEVFAILEAAELKCHILEKRIESTLKKHSL